MYKNQFNVAAGHNLISTCMESNIKFDKVQSIGMKIYETSVIVYDQFIKEIKNKYYESERMIILGLIRQAGMMWIFEKMNSDLFNIILKMIHPLDLMDMYTTRDDESLIKFDSQLKDYFCDNIYNFYSIDNNKEKIMKFSKQLTL